MRVRPASLVLASASLAEIQTMCSSCCYDDDFLFHPAAGLYCQSQGMAYLEVPQAVERGAALPEREQVAAECVDPLLGIQQHAGLGAQPSSLEEVFC